MSMTASMSLKTASSSPDASAPPFSTKSIWVAPCSSAFEASNALTLRIWLAVRVPDHGAEGDARAAEGALRGLDKPRVDGQRCKVVLDGQRHRGIEVGK